MLTVSKDFEGKTDKVEKYYGFHYAVESLSEERLSSWSKPRVCERLHLPKRNEFIPDDFTLLPKPESVPGSRPDGGPVMIEDSNMVRAWFKQDDQFETPRVTMVFNISTPLVYSSPLNWSLTLMAVRLLDDALTEFVYDASLAGLAYGLEK